MRRDEHCTLQKLREAAAVELSHDRHRVNVIEYHALTILLLSHVRQQRSCDNLSPHTCRHDIGVSTVWTNIINCTQGRVYPKADLHYVCLWAVNDGYTFNTALCLFLMKMYSDLIWTFVYERNITRPLRFDRIRYILLFK